MKKDEEIKIRDILESFVDEFLPYLDCDGCTRFVAFMLENKNIDFMIFTGSIKNDKHFFPLHYWIETSNGVTFDFKCEKWIGTKSDKTTYNVQEEINKEKFLSVGGNKELIMGILLKYGSENKNGVIIKCQKN